MWGVCCCAPPARCRGRLAAPFCERLARCRIRLRMRRSRLLPGQGELVHQLAHMRGVVRRAPALLNLVAQLGQGPGAQARGLHVWPVQHQPLQGCLLRPVQPRRPTRARSVVQSGKTLGVVAHNGIAQRLPVHAGEPRCLSPRQALQRARNRLHARGRRSIFLPPRQPSQLRRRYLRADLQRSATHRVLPSWVGRNRITSPRVASTHV